METLNESAPFAATPLQPLQLAAIARGTFWEEMDERTHGMFFFQKNSSREMTFYNNAIILVVLIPPIVYFSLLPYYYSILDFHHLNFQD